MDFLNFFLYIYIYKKFSIVCVIIIGIVVGQK